MSNTIISLIEPADRASLRHHLSFSAHNNQYVGLKINNITVTIYYLSGWPSINRTLGPKQEGNFYINAKKLGMSQLGLMHELATGQCLVPSLLR